MFYSPYISIILLAEQKSMRTKMLEIKYEINTTPCRTSNAVDPAKNGAKRTRIERDMLNSCPGMKRASQPTARIDGIDRDFLFWNPCSHAGCSPFPSRLGVTQVCEGLALVYTNNFNVYLGFVTNFGSPGTGPGILAPGWGRVGYKTPSTSCGR
jgi:hypothetical protein